MFNPLRANALYRDFWSDVNAFATERTDDILQSGCYVPRWYHAPSNELALLTGPNGYLQYALHIPAGSWVFGFWHHVQTAPGVAPLYWVKITDGALNHPFFENPVPESYFGEAGFNRPWMLDYPYPMIAPGILLIEFWVQVSQTVTLDLTLGVAEVAAEVIGESHRGAA